jgi:glutamate racemase
MEHHLSIRSIITVALLMLIFTACNKPDGIRDAMMNHPGSYYYIDFKNYPSGNHALPIGVFDSGTGGLSVLADITSHEELAKESYIYYGDLANMPYGSYALEDNTPLLIEHVIKDVQFLLGNKYYRSAGAKRYETDKNPVKVIVIACNTATAYALDTVRHFLAEAGSNIGVIGVVEAGALGAFGNFSPGESGTIAVMATDGTVRSGAYPRSISKVNKADGQEEQIEVFQQAGIGIAEAIDESAEAIDRRATTPRPGYRGPSDTCTGEMKIDLRLWNRYDFDLENNALLFEGDPSSPANIQINSVENYIAYHVVSLMEKIRNTPEALPLNSVVLACTHYPFFLETFRQEFERLRNFRENGEYIYRSLIAEDLILVNPASVVAEQLYAHLADNNLLNNIGLSASEFYVSVPNLLNRKVELRDDGSFTYDYKYGRKADDLQEYVRAVPFSRTSIPAEILIRLSQQIPVVYHLMVSFNNENVMTEYLELNERFVAQ